MVALGSFEIAVSTHSRLKAAGNGIRESYALPMVSTHSRLKAAGLPSKNL